MRTATVLLLAPLLAPVARAQTPEVPIVHETKGEFSADALAFESRIEIDASCPEVFASLTEIKRVGALVPHLHGKAKITKAANPGDTMWYEFDRKDGSKNSGRFVLTTIEENSRVQFLVQPDAGPWLRVQEFRLFAPAAGPKKDSQCAVI